MARSHKKSGSGTKWLTPLVPALLAWYAGHRRDLPWRDSADPYAVWVSEVMLQQTQVATARPYFERFMVRFPTVLDLAAAPLADVLTMWQGLGYYARARHLHAAAQAIARDFGGRLPATAAALRRLPGIGRYTAGAVASIAFGEAVPAVDGNVKRLIARLYGVQDDVSSSAGENRVWDLAAGLHDGSPAARHDEVGPRNHAVDFHPGDLNQALIELGALICKPRSPRCDACPLSAHCVAYREGQPSALPVHRRPNPPRRASCLALILRRSDGRYLVAKRPAPGLLGGLWEYPLVTSPPPFIDLVSLPTLNLPPIEHTFSHLHLTLTPLLVNVDHAADLPSLPDSIATFHRRVSERSPAYPVDATPGIPDAYEAWDWVTPSALAALPISTLMRKLIERSANWRDDASHQPRDADETPTTSTRPYAALTKTTS